jgi:hypothetical protein
MYSAVFSGSTCGRERAPHPSRYAEIDRDLVSFLALKFFQYAAVMGTNPQLLHPYAYADNDPVNKSDPTGLRASPQTPGCDRVPDLTPCVTQCCNDHDRCFQNAPFSWCDESSWRDFFQRPARSRIDCLDCNITVAKCLIRSLTLGGRKDCR